MAKFWKNQKIWTENGKVLEKLENLDGKWENGKVLDTGGGGL